MSTLLHEQGYNTAWIELQLTHVDKNTIRGTYNHAQYLEQRREMFLWYPGADRYSHETEVFCGASGGGLLLNPICLLIPVVLSFVVRWLNRLRIGKVRSTD
ncbi:Integrase [Kosakonia radicincitans]|nr:Integrase [Kosakonia radicincitans]